VFQFGLDAQALLVLLAHLLGDRQRRQQDDDSATVTKLVATTNS
jgi:hypothetical protein